MASVLPAPQGQDTGESAASTAAAHAAAPPGGCRPITELGAVQEETYIPLRLAKQKIAMIHADMERAKAEHLDVLRKLDEAYRAADAVTQKTFVDFVDSLKAKHRDKLVRVQSVVQELNQRLSDSQTKASSVEESNRTLQSTIADLNGALRLAHEKYEDTQMQLEDLREESLGAENTFKSALQSSIRSETTSRKRMEEFEDLIRSLYEMDEELATSWEKWKAANESLRGLESQLAQLGADRRDVKKRIQQWMSEFEEREGRKPEKEDKRVIKDDFVKFKILNDQFETMEREVQEERMKLQEQGKEFKLRFKENNRRLSFKNKAELIHLLEKSCQTDAAATDPALLSTGEGRSGDGGVLLAHNQRLSQELGASQAELKRVNDELSRVRGQYVALLASPGGVPASDGPGSPAPAGTSSPGTGRRDSRAGERRGSIVKPGFSGAVAGAAHTGSSSSASSGQGKQQLVSDAAQQQRVAALSEELKRVMASLTASQELVEKHQTESNDLRNSVEDLRSEKKSLEARVKALSREVEKQQRQQLAAQSSRAEKDAKAAMDDGAAAGCGIGSATETGAPHVQDGLTDRRAAAAESAAGDVGTGSAHADDASDISGDSKRASEEDLRAELEALRVENERLRALAAADPGDLDADAEAAVGSGDHDEVGDSAPDSGAVLSQESDAATKPSSSADSQGGPSKSASSKSGSAVAVVGAGSAKPLGVGNLVLSAPSAGADSAAGAERVKKLQEQNAVLQKKLKQMEIDLRKATAAKGSGAGGSSSSDVKGMELEMKAAEQRYKKEISDLQKKADGELKAAVDKSERFEREYQKHKGRADKAEADLAALQKEFDKLSKSTSGASKEISTLQKQLEDAQQQMAELDGVRLELSSLKKDKVQLEQAYKDEQTLRKKLHNEIEDMKGKIRVYCRVRPLSRTERERNDQMAVAFPDEYTINVIPKQRDFLYDRVFAPEESQEEVFSDSQHLIQSAVDGYNVCIFAYGQTGSGKTFTIAGDPQNPGIVPRAMRKLYDILQGQSKIATFSVSCYMLELYNDMLYDLFFQEKGESPRLEIKKDAKGMVVVSGALIREANSYDVLQKLYQVGSSSRHVRSTDMNAQSSRSHLVFSILIEVTNKETKQTAKGKLSIVDLAGSERLAKTNITDAQGILEAKSINKSLTALGDVISALSTGEAFIPYRNNKLTLLMSDSLGGNAKTLMFVNLSPADYNTDETVTSLQYASRVKLITNDASKNSESKEVARLQGIIKQLKQAATANAVDVSSLEYSDV